MNDKFLVYWSFILLQLILAFFAYQFGIFSMIYTSDVTWLSFVILGIHVATSIIIGYFTFRNKPVDTKPLWFISETQLSIGMIGTLVGFVILFSTVFSSIQTPDDVSSALVSIASGVGTALWTTLSGLVSSVFLKIKIVNIERKENG